MKMLRWFISVLLVSIKIHVMGSNLHSLEVQAKVY